MAASRSTLVTSRLARRLASRQDRVVSGQVPSLNTTTALKASESTFNAFEDGNRKPQTVSASTKAYAFKGGVRNVSAFAKRMPDPAVTRLAHRFREFELDDRVFVVTGGARGLGLALAEAIVEAGGHVYCVDRLFKPAHEFYETQERVSKLQGSLEYRQVDVQDAANLDAVVTSIAAEHQRLDGLIAAAGVQFVSPALNYPPEKITEMMNINYGGVYLSAVSCARQMAKYHCNGSMVLVGSMSGLVANRGLLSSVYNSSKAAVLQPGRSLAMEWAKVVDGKAIRVNVLCPGNVITPISWTTYEILASTDFSKMVMQSFKTQPHLKAMWENGNMMGRLSTPDEYRGAALFLLSDASSFTTGSNLVIGGGYTAW